MQNRALRQIYYPKEKPLTPLHRLAEIDTVQEFQTKIISIYTKGK